MARQPAAARNTQQKPTDAPLEGDVMQPGEGGEGPISAAIQALSETQSLAMNLTRAEIDQQVATAKRYPRSVAEAVRRIESLATLDEQAAAECLYSLERRSGDGTKNAIIGPSIRFAELVMQSWHNCRVAARVTDIGKSHVEATGVFYDLESNTATAKSSQRRITTRDGKRFGDDMINVTANAAASIALRNAILAGVPKAVWRKGFEKALMVTKGTADTLQARKSAMLQAFKNHGASQAQVWQLLDVKGADDVTLDTMVLAAGLLNRLADGAALAALLEEAGAAVTGETKAGPTLSQGAAGAQEKVDPKTGEVTTTPPAADKPQAENVKPKPEPDKPADPPKEEPKAEPPKESPAAQEAAQEAQEPAAATTPAAEAGEAAADAPQAQDDAPAQEGAGGDDAAMFEATDDAAEETATEEAGPPAAVQTMRASLDEAVDWPGVRAAVQAVCMSDWWKSEANPAQKDGAMAMAWSFALALPEDKRPNPTKDPAAFRLFMAYTTDESVIDAKWSDLVGGAAWSKLPDPAKNSLINEKKARLAAIRAGEA